MSALPAGSAKSTFVSILFPPWYLGHAPGSRLARARNVLAASHTTELAARFGRGLLLGGYLNPAVLRFTRRCGWRLHLQ